MLRFIFFIIFSTFSLYAYIDTDMDGVADSDDMCPNTPITDLVDLSGCSKKSLVSPHHFSLIVGQRYEKDINSTYAYSSIELDYYYKNFSMQLTTDYYKMKSSDTNTSGINDVYVNMYYMFSPLEHFKLSLSTGIALPTYDSIDNKTDYSFSLYGRYDVNKWSFSTSVGYQFIGDIGAQNTLDYRLTTGYNWNDAFYSSISYSMSENMYAKNADFTALSLYSYYKINKNWFSTVRYSYGLNDSNLDQSMGVDIGYSW